MDDDKLLLFEQEIKAAVESLILGIRSVNDSCNQLQAENKRLQADNEQLRTDLAVASVVHGRCEQEIERLRAELVKWTTPVRLEGEE